MPSDESKGSQLDAIGSLAQRQLDNTLLIYGLFQKGRVLAQDGVVSVTRGTWTRFS